MAICYLRSVRDQPVSLIIIDKESHASNRSGIRITATNSAVPTIQAVVQSQRTIAAHAQLRSLAGDRLSSRTVVPVGQDGVKTAVE